MRNIALATSQNKISLTFVIFYFISVNVHFISSRKKLYGLFLVLVNDNIWFNFSSISICKNVFNNKKYIYIYVSIDNIPDLWFDIFALALIRLFMIE